LGVWAIQSGPMVNHSLPTGVVIRGAASYVPDREVSSAELGERLGLTHDEIVHRTGIHSRRWAAPEQSAASLGEIAGRRVLEKTGVAPEEVDLVLLSTTSADMPFPSTACLVQARLGIPNAGAMDVMASCSGFLAALSIARGQILSGMARRVLIICADVKSRFLDLDDPSTAIIFGDGAGAALVEGVFGPSVGGHIGPVFLHTDGSRWKWVHMPAGGSRQPLSHDTLDANLHTLKMDGIPLFRMAVTRFSQVIREALDADGMSVDDIDCFVFHQANLRILEAVGKRLGLPTNKVATTLQRYGNTSSASLPITLDRALADGSIGAGSQVLLATFGGGITWGACRVTWHG